MIFDPDCYIDSKLEQDASSLINNIDSLKPPNNKIQATNIAKLAPDKKVIQICVSPTPPARNDCNLCAGRCQVGR